MKTAEFEKAILALGSDIVIDEVKLRHSGVRQVNGHTDKLLVVWDEYGRGFSAEKNRETEVFLTDNDDGHITSAKGVAIARDTSFDLNFD